MVVSLRRADSIRPPGAFARAYAAFAATAFARFVSRHVNWKLDPLLLRVTRGRLASTLVFPTALLETTGVRSGERRRNAVIYVPDGDRFVIVASNAGAAHHPAWLHNLRAHPEVTFGGNPMVAAEVDDPAERERLQAATDRAFPTFARYRHDATATGRTIPIVVLTPVPSALGRQNPAR